MSNITILEEQLMLEIVSDPTALQLLKDKCSWERMSRYAVLREWGDPRNWPAYKEDKAAEATAGAEE
ncbi:MAG: hypothetical protein ACW99U_21300 [Candidatus Thorarchaeota archaeon]|jgi:hypothetical protein